MLLKGEKNQNPESKSNGYFVYLFATKSDFVFKDFKTLKGLSCLSWDQAGYSSAAKQKSRSKCGAY